MRAAFVVTVLAVLASLAGSVRRLVHVPDPAALDAAAAHVRAEWQDGDRVVVAPYYPVGIRQRLGDLPLLQPRRLEAEMLEGAARLHLVELDVLGATGDAAELLGALATAEATAAFDGVRITRFAPKRRERRVLDLRDQLSELRVEAEYPGQPSVPCGRFDSDRWLCPRNPGWNYVGRESFLIGGERRDCLWLHPITGGVLRLTATMPAAGVRELRASFGFTANGVRAARAPVQTRVLGDGVEVLSATVPRGAGWHAFRAPFTAQTLVLELRSDDDGAAHVCGDVRLVEEVP